MTLVTGASSGLIRARRVLTLRSGSEGDSVLWRNGRIEAVGPAAKLNRAAPPAVPRYDLPDVLVTPGLVDGHTHLALWALNRRRLELSGLRTREQVIARVAPLARCRAG